MLNEISQLCRCFEPSKIAATTPKTAREPSCWSSDPENLGISRKFAPGSLGKWSHACSSDGLGEKSPWWLQAETQACGMERGQGSDQQEAGGGRVSFDMEQGKSDWTGTHPSALGVKAGQGTEEPGAADPDLSGLT